MSSRATLDDAHRYQRQLATFCMDRESSKEIPNSPDALPKGEWAVYRRLIRLRLMKTLRHGFERLHGRLGEDVFTRWVADFLSTKGPRSIYLRELPGEFLSYLSDHRSSTREALPAFALDLARFEWAELDVAYTHEEVGVGEVGDLAMDQAVRLAPAHRLLRLRHRVHDLQPDSPDADIVAACVWVCLYRDRETHDVRVLELNDFAGRFLESLRGGTTVLSDCFRAVASDAGMDLGATFIGQLTDILADLVERGIVLGSAV